jgi:hypothetical protein
MNDDFWSAICFYCFSVLRSLDLLDLSHAITITPLFLLAIARCRKRLRNAFRQKVLRIYSTLPVYLYTVAAADGRCSFLFTVRCAVP